MTERPILFSAPMVRAILSGTKTQTRRVLKLRGAEVVEEPAGPYDPWPWSPESDDWVPCPYGDVDQGTRLWVKETFAPCTARIREGNFHYRADGAVGHRVSTNGGESWWSQTGHTLGLSAKDLQGVWVGPPKRWKPSIFMPREASRITLEVTGVRVERLQAISEADAKAEGVDAPYIDREEPDRALCPLCGGTGLYTSFGENFGARPDTDCARCDTSAKRYRWLWESINGTKSWDSNPWVWVVEFKRVEQ